MPNAEWSSMNPDHHRYRSYSSSSSVTSAIFDAVIDNVGKAGTAAGKAAVKGAKRTFSVLSMSSTEGDSPPTFRKIFKRRHVQTSPPHFSDVTSHPHELLRHYEAVQIQAPYGYYDPAELQPPNGRDQAGEGPSYHPDALLPELLNQSGGFQSRMNFLAGAGESPQYFFDSPPPLSPNRLSNTSQPTVAPQSTLLPVAQVVSPPSRPRQSGRDPLRCPSCDKIKEGMNRLRQHMSRVHVQTHKCPRLNCKFQNSFAVVKRHLKSCRHPKLHNDDRPVSRAEARGYTSELKKNMPYDSLCALYHRWFPKDLALERGSDDAPHQGHDQFASSDQHMHDVRLAALPPQASSSTATRPPSVDPIFQTLHTAWERALDSVQKTNPHPNPADKQAVYEALCQKLGELALGHTPAYWMQDTPWSPVSSTTGMPSLGVASPLPAEVAGTAPGPSTDSTQLTDNSMLTPYDVTYQDQNTDSSSMDVRSMDLRSIAPSYDASLFDPADSYANEFKGKGKQKLYDETDHDD